MAEKPKSEKWKGARTRNLTAAQQKQAKRIVGGGRSEKVTAAERKASQAKVDIGQTKWVTAKDRGGAGRGGLLTDTSGKAVTGTVTLPSGKTATYVRGKRIGVVAKAGGGPSTTRRVTPKPKPRTTNDLTAEERNRLRGNGPTKARATGPKMSSKRNYGTTDTSTLSGIKRASAKGKKPPTKSMKAPINWGRTVSW